MTFIVSNLEIMASNGNAWTLGEVSFSRQVAGNAIAVNYTFDTAPSAIDIEATGNPEIILIVNMDSVNDLIVDVSPSMDVFAQRIRPGRGVYLTTTNTSIYIASSESAADAYILSSTAIQIRAIRELSTLSFITEFSALLPPKDLYIQFDVNWHDAATVGFGSDVFDIGLNDDSNWIGVFSYDQGSGSFWAFYSWTGGSNGATTPVILDTWYTMGIKIEYTGSYTVTPRVDGVDYASFNPGTVSLEKIHFGAWWSGASNNHELDNLTIGTSGWGSSDIFSANFDDFSIAPPFDSITGTGLDASSGTLTVVNGGGDAYAIKAVSWP